MRTLLQWIAQWWNGPKQPTKPNPPPAVPPKLPVPIPNGVVSALLDAHNFQRSTNNVGPLKLNGQLIAAAQGHAGWMALNRDMDHNERPGTPQFSGASFVDRATAQGYRMGAGGENIAAGQQSVDSVMAAWMTSPGHRSNILSPAYLEAGFGTAQDSSGNNYWCAVFASPVLSRSMRIIHTNCPVALVAQ